jgi:hypothetical protein
MQESEAADRLLLYPTPYRNGNAVGNFAPTSQAAALSGRNGRPMWVRINRDDIFR